MDPDLRSLRSYQLEEGDIGSLSVVGLSGLPVYYSRSELIAPGNSFRQMLSSDLKVLRDPGGVRTSGVIVEGRANVTCHKAVLGDRGGQSGGYRIVDDGSEGGPEKGEAIDQTRFELESKTSHLTPWLTKHPEFHRTALCSDPEAQPGILRGPKASRTTA